LLRQQKNIYKTNTNNKTRKMKKALLFFLVMVLFFNLKGFSQETANPSAFHGAVASLKSYKALYIIDQSDAKKMKMVLRNINNALDDPRLKGKLQVELIAFADGVEIYKKSNHLDTMLLNLQKRGVILAECENTIRERNISKDELWPFISYVPSGNGEIIIRQQQGWATVHP
jgi:intracellular sulfur oxidation DsrE/DsrF family protein